MTSGPPHDLTEFFRDLEDPRIERAKRHELLDIVIIAICGVICHADTWVDIEMFGKAKEEWFRTFLELPNGIPSHDTFGRVFARLDPEQFQACFRDWVEAVQEVTAGQVVAIDGKTARRSHDRGDGKKALHMISAWATENHLVLGQRKVDGKSNEITALPALLELLTLKGCIVTIDAMGCQTKVAETIRKQGADYVLAVKGNRPRLHEHLKGVFSGTGTANFAQVPHDHHRTVEKSHGRIEIRDYWTISDPEYLDYLQATGEWPDLGCVAMVFAERRVDDEISYATRYYISSLPGDAKALGRAIRGHWGVENELHWTLDVAFREDDSRVRIGHAQENLVVLRHIALNLVKHEKSLKRSVNGKRLVAGWNSDYLMTILRAA